MTIWTCANCAIEHPDTDAPALICEICADERQYLPVGGQRWATREELLAEGYRVAVEELETDLFSVEAVPRLGIGQRGLLVRTAHGNVLWEPPGLVDDAAVAAIEALGGVAAVTASHPHLTGSSIQWSHAFGGAPVYVAAADAQWIRRPDPVITLWDGAVDVLPGLTMHQCGGHFAGSSVLHWPDGAAGRGALLTGDTVAVGADRASVNVMRSFVNNIPLPEVAVQRILDTVMGLRFDRLYGAFGIIDATARPVVGWSLRRYIDWLRGTPPE